MVEISKVTTTVAMKCAKGSQRLMVSAPWMLDLQMAKLWSIDARISATYPNFALCIYIIKSYL